MGYLNRKFVKDLKKKKSDNHLNTVNSSEFKDALGRFRIRKDEVYDVMNDMEKDGLISREGRKIKLL